MLAAIAAEAEACTRCRLATARHAVVVARGNPESRLMFVGEGPGAEEDRQGLPFVGPAGQLLDRIIAAMGFGRDEVYIANVVKCRPPGNRVPMFDEVEACTPFLRRQIAAVRPDVIVALGATAARMLVGVNGTMASFRGRWHAYEGTPLYVTYHPAYLLRQPGEKRKVWDDMKVVLERLRLPIPER